MKKILVIAVAPIGSSLAWLLAAQAQSFGNWFTGAMRIPPMTHAFGYLPYTGTRDTDL